MNSKEPFLNLAAYNASKAAVNSYTIGLSWELRKEDIKVNCGHPGWIATRLNAFHKDGLKPEDGAKTLLKWALLGPEDKEKTGEKSINVTQLELTSFSGVFFGPDGELPW